jgi:hypothetical protein
MQLVNMKSKYKPFSILRHQDNPKIDIYSGEIRREVTVFPWWNHWPVAQKPTDGRWAMYADRPSHSSLSHWFWDAYDVDERSMTKLMLTGFTDKKAEDLLPLAKSWSQPPEVKSKNDVKITYNQPERCFDVHMNKAAKSIEFEIRASSESPLINPAFVLYGWGNRGVNIEIDGKSIKAGKNFRTGHRHRLEGIDAISWLRYTSEKPVKVKIEAQ